jgi:hypothetical protein
MLRSELAKIFEVNWKSPLNDGNRKLLILGSYNSIWLRPADGDPADGDPANGDGNMCNGFLSTQTQAWNKCR